MQKQELHDILYRQQLSMSDKNKLYNFIKKFVDLFKGDKIDDKYLPNINTNIEKINLRNTKIVSYTHQIISLGAENTSLIFNDYDHNDATGEYSIAEGQYSLAQGDYSHAEGRSVHTLGDYSHGEGAFNYTNGDYSHVEGCSNHANGDYSHAEGLCTTASGDYSHAEGISNVSDKDAIHQVGIGTTNNSHTFKSCKDAYRITKDGKHYILNIGGFDGTKATADLTTEKDLASVITDLTNRIVALEAKQTTT